MTLDLFDLSGPAPTPVDRGDRPYYDDAEWLTEGPGSVLTRYTWADVWAVFKEPLKGFVLLGLLISICLSAYIYWAMCQMEAVR